MEISEGSRPPRLSRTARRDISILATSRAITQFGSMLTLIAVALELQPRGVGLVAAAMAAELIPSIVLAPFAGWLLDKVPNRPVMLAAYVVQAASSLGLAILIHHVAAVLILLVVIGSAAAIAGPAQSSLIPVAAGSTGAPRAYSYMSTAGTIGFLFGLASAGFLVQAFGPRGALAIDSASYLVEAVGVALLFASRDPRLLQDPAPTDVHTSTDSIPSSPTFDKSVHEGAPEKSDEIRLRDGMTLIVKDTVLRIVLPGMAICLLASTVVNVASVFLVVGELQAPPAVYGIVEATWGIGSLVGAWLAGRATRESAHARIALFGGVIMGLALASAGALVSVPGTIAAWLVGGTANSMQNVGSQALINARVPSRLHGSVFGAFVSMLQTSNVASLLLGSLLVAALGASGTLIASGCVAGAVSAGALLMLRASRMGADTSSAAQSRASALKHE